MSFWIHRKFQVWGCLSLLRGYYFITTIFSVFLLKVPEEMKYAWSSREVQQKTYFSGGWGQRFSVFQFSENAQRKRGSLGYFSDAARVKQVWKSCFLHPYPELPGHVRNSIADAFQNLQNLVAHTPQLAPLNALSVRRQLFVIKTIDSYFCLIAV